MILASKSPRRKEILENFGFNLKVISKEIEEVSSEIEIIDKIKDISYKKTLEVAKDYPNEYVVGADTVVVINNTILGKPKNKEEVYEMLNLLSNNTHEVITAFSFINISKNINLSEGDITRVKFKNITPSDINWYIDTQEPFDKAGSYGIQGHGSYFVENINGDFFSVMGFPLGRFIRSLTKLGFSLEELKKL